MASAKVGVFSAGVQIKKYDGHVRKIQNIFIPSNFYLSIRPDQVETLELACRSIPPNPMTNQVRLDFARLFAYYVYKDIGISVLLLISNWRSSRRLRAVT